MATQALTSAFPPRKSESPTPHALRGEFGRGLCRILKKEAQSGKPSEKLVARQWTAKHTAMHYTAPRQQRNMRKGQIYGPARIKFTTEIIYVCFTVTNEIYLIAGWCVTKRTVYFKGSALWYEELALSVYLTNSKSRSLHHGDRNDKVGTYTYRANCLW